MSFSKSLLKEHDERAYTPVRPNFLSVFDNLPARVKTETITTQSIQKGTSNLLAPQRVSIDASQSVRWTNLNRDENVNNSSNTNKSLVQMSWEPVPYKSSSIGNTTSVFESKKSLIPSNFNSVRPSYLPHRPEGNSSGDKTNSDLSGALQSTTKITDKVQSLKVDNDRLRQISYDNMVSSLQSQSDSTMTKQRQEIYQMKMAMEDKNKMIDSLQKQVAELNRKIATFVPTVVEKVVIKEVKVIDEAAMRKLKDQIDELKSQNQELQDELARRNEKNQELMDEIDHLNQLLQESESTSTQVTTLVSEVNTWKKKFVDLNREFHNTQEELMMTQAELENLKKGKDRTVVKVTETKTEGKRSTVISSEQQLP